MERMDVLTGRESNGKTYWTKIGVAFHAKNGDGWDVMLDALPVNGKMILRPAKAKEDRPVADSGRATRGHDDGIEDPIPF